MVKWAQMIERREPMVTDVIRFMDGLSLHSKCTSDTYEQNVIYNSYHSDTMVNNVFAHGADGKVFLFGLNFPGSCHDGSITANLLPIIIEKNGSFKICIDQALPGVVMRMVFWLDIVNDQQSDFPQFSSHIN